MYTAATQLAEVFNTRNSSLYVKKPAFVIMPLQTTVHELEEKIE